MKIKIILLLLLVLKALPSLASKTDTIKLYYPIDKYELSTENKTKLDGLKPLLADSSKVEILGYADYLGKSKHNMILSQNRAETVKQYLLGINNKLVVTVSGKGAVQSEADTSPDGEPPSRRVDVIYEIKRPPVVVKKTVPQVIKVTPPQVPKPTVPVPPSRKRDTVPARPKIVVIVDSPSVHISFNERVNKLKDAKVGSSISFEELTFQPGRHFLNQEAVRYVNTILKYMQKHPNITFEILGHICCEVDGRDGQDYDTGGYVLSVNRAKFIYDYFIEKGIEAKRMSYKGLASTRQKVFPERSEHDRYLNRRVEFLIMGK
jgi:outer membrane protein OmpA-like peptidoglycan-associated protein